MEDYKALKRRKAHPVEVRTDDPEFLKRMGFESHEDFLAWRAQNNMRELTEHKVNPANDQLVVQVLDEPGHGGACHEYLVSGFESILSDGEKQIKVKDSCRIKFQNGPIAEAGVNGLTQEVLLNIVADRLRGFQSGPYAHPLNGKALTYVEEALSTLKQRTTERMQRGVEGTHTV